MKKKTRDETWESRIEKLLGGMTKDLRKSHMETYFYRSFLK